MIAAIDLTGQRFTRLLVIKRSVEDSLKWECLCDCSKTTFVLTGNLTHGTTRSCGCLMREKNLQIHTTHGMSGTPEYAAWGNIIQRCTNTKDTAFEYYGGRGIQVCDRWHNSFEAFFFDMGPRPTDNHSIDRYPDQNGNYEPRNCRWATWTEQQTNKRNNNYQEYNGDIKTITEISRENNISWSTLKLRLSKGQTVKQAVETPLRPQLMITYNGETKNLGEWANTLGILYRVLYSRIVIYGWTVEKAFTTEYKARSKNE